MTCIRVATNSEQPEYMLNDTDHTDLLAVVQEINPLQECGDTAANNVLLPSTLLDVKCGAIPIAICSATSAEVFERNRMM